MLTPVVLIVEDDDRNSEVLTQIVQELGFASVISGTGGTACEIARKSRLSVLLLDLGLPDMTGVSVLKEVRSFSDVPIIIITGWLGNKFTDACLNLGANAYLEKPVNNDELRLMIREFIPKASVSPQIPELTRFKSTGLEINFATNSVVVDRLEAHLSITEYRILCVLAHNPGQFVRTEMILRDVWPHASYQNDIGIVRVNIARLRLKLGDNAESPKYIIAEPGRGYSLIVC